MKVRKAITFYCDTWLSLHGEKYAQKYLSQDVNWRVTLQCGVWYLTRDKPFPYKSIRSALFQYRVWFCPQKILNSRYLREVNLSCGNTTSPPLLGTGRGSVSALLHGLLPLPLLLPVDGEGQHAVLGAPVHLGELEGGPAGEEALPEHALTPLDDEAGALGAAEGRHGQSEHALRQSGEQQLCGQGGDG